MILEITGLVILTVGVLFLILGAAGILRLPDVYNRLQAGTKATTLGAFFSLTGIGLVEPAWLLKCLVIGVFILLTNPISAHALARACRKTGVPLAEGSVVDKCEELNGCAELTEEGDRGE